MLDKNALSALNVVTGLSLDEQGMLWMATGKGLYSLRLSDRKVKSYHNVKDGKHVCAFNNITRFGEFEYFVEVGCNIISSLSSDGKNMLYVGTDGNGVHFIATDRRNGRKGNRIKLVSSVGMSVPRLRMSIPTLEMSIPRLGIETMF